MDCRKCLVMLACCCSVGQISASVARAEVRLPKIFGDHMVLQQGKPIPVWGWAATGEQVTVTLAGETAQATADQLGKWKAVLPPLKGNGPMEMKVEGKSNVVTFTDVLLGEVWVCSGQSNMEVPVGLRPDLTWWKGVSDYQQELMTANRPTLRLFLVAPTWEPTPIDDVDGKWQVCTPETAAAFSGTAYFFGRKLNQELGQPVGLVQAAVGGMPIEQFTPPPDQAFWYNGMIAPIIPYAIRGAIWYQGETNFWAGDGMNYFPKQQKLIESWRRNWQQGQFPFYFVQIAPMESADNRHGLPRFWEAQFRTLTLPNTGIVSTTDIGDVHDVHPRNKKGVGERLARWALARDYDRQVVCCGPTYKSMHIDGSEIRITFDHVGSGLQARDGEPLSEFEIAGDGDFVPADAVIAGNTVVLSSRDIPRPTMVRLGWNCTANPNLQNKEGLPAYPFRTCGSAPDIAGRRSFSESSAVRLTAADPASTIRYTLDGSAPTAASARYTEPIVVRGTTTVRARCFRSDGVESNAVQAVFTKIPPRPYNGKTLVLGLRYDYYEGQWSSLPDFSQLTPADSGTVEDFELTPRKRDDHFAFRFTGLIEIKEPGEYSFQTASDDGSELFVDEREVVSNDGLHGVVMKEGTIRLDPGMHKIAVTYFEGASGEALTVKYKGPAIPLQEIPCWCEP